MVGRQIFSRSATGYGGCDMEPGNGSYGYRGPLTILAAWIYPAYSADGSANCLIRARRHPLPRARRSWRRGIVLFNDYANINSCLFSAPKPSDTLGLLSIRH